MGNWFTENLELVQGQRQQIAVRELLHGERSEYQKIEIYQTESYRRMLVLDDIVNVVEADEYCYHEMIAHVPLFSHAEPKRVLIIGGGDGGTLREVLKHPSVEEAHLCEIDRRVVELSREFLPSLAGGFADPRVRVLYEDGARWAREHENTYDVLIVDSTDPVGMAAVLFEYDFFRDCSRALTEDGILVTQAENFLLHADLIQELIGYGKKLFPNPGYYYTHVPTYPGGMIGFTFFSKKYSSGENLEAKLADPNIKRWTEDLRYWTADIHRASFVLPAETERKLFG